MTRWGVRIRVWVSFICFASKSSRWSDGPLDQTNMGSEESGCSIHETAQIFVVSRCLKWHTQLDQYCFFLLNPWASTSSSSIYASIINLRAANRNICKRAMKDHNIVEFYYLVLGSLSYISNRHRGLWQFCRYPSHLYAIVMRDGI
jgi:hypothetical protein